MDAEISFFQLFLCIVCNQLASYRLPYQARSTVIFSLIDKVCINFFPALSFKDLETLERLSFAKNPGKAKQLFRISQHDRSAAAALEKEAMQNVDSKRKSSIFAKTLSSLGRAEGFEVPPYCNVSPLRKAPVSRIDEREEEEIYYKDGLDDYFEDEDEDEESNESF